MAVVRDRQFEESPLYPDQLCVATQNFSAQQDGDLPFKPGDKITIVSPCEEMYWYIAKDEKGRKGMVPGNFLKPLKDPTPHQPQQCGHTKPLTHRESVGYVDMATGMKASTAGSGGGGEGYLSMAAGGNYVDQELLLLQEKEKRRRLRPGTLVMGTCAFPGEQPEDLPFDVYEEMHIINPLPDLCWYMAQKTEEPDKKGIIPVSHVRLVYISDDEDEGAPASEPSKEIHDRLYEDQSEFMYQSGWFTFSGMPQDKAALSYVLAKKCRLSYEKFMETKEAVYAFNFMQGEKIFVGKASVLHVELCKHFDNFGKKRDEIREIDDELCHHTDASGWEITVWPLQPGEVLEVEWVKKVIQQDSLKSKEGGSGINEEITFSSMGSLQTFWDWFSPN